MSQNVEKIAWKRIPIVDLCEVHVDCVNRTAKTVEEATPYKMIRTTNVREGFIDTENVKYVSEETYKRWTRRLIPQRGDIILTREAPLGEVGMLRVDEHVFLGQRLYHFRAAPDKLDSNFLLYSLLANDLQAQIRRFGSGSTVEHMRLEDIPELKISVPPLIVQKIISEILSAYDVLIENNRRRIKILEEMARSLYREWFIYFRYPGHESVPFVSSPHGLIPKGWETKKLGEVLELNYGKALKQEDRQEGVVPVYGSSGIVGFHNFGLVRGPGIVVGRKGNVGSIYWSDVDFYPIDTVYFITSPFPFRFLFFDLQNKNFINNDSAVPGLNRNQAYSLKILLPPKDLLLSFCKFADDFCNQANLLKKQNENLQCTRDLLLPRLISGQMPLNGKTSVA
jgi:type I restriction enzyme, S subunit